MALSSFVGRTIGPNSVSTSTDTPPHSAAGMEFMIRQYPRRRILCRTPNLTARRSIDGRLASEVWSALMLRRPETGVAEYPILCVGRVAFRANPNPPRQTPCRGIQLPYADAGTGDRAFETLKEPLKYPVVLTGWVWSFTVHSGDSDNGPVRINCPSSAKCSSQRSTGGPYAVVG